MRVREARAVLGWPDAASVARAHASGATLVLAAPWDGLLTATEVAEWCLVAALAQRDRHWWARVHAAQLALAQAEQGVEPPEPIADFESALRRLRRLALEEARPGLLRLLDAAAVREVSCLMDDERLTLGCGAGGRTWERDHLPVPAEVPWADLHDVPVAVVTGSNGKTTTVRAIAACAAAHGWRVGLSSTDGLSIAGRQLAAGDYSGPQGARTVLREPEVQAAVLETARGGLLRRGLALQRASVAVITNVSADHFGEYGVHDLAMLTEVKFTVAQLVRGGGLLVLNADDGQCVARAATTRAQFGWFAQDAAHPVLAAHRAAGGLTCGARDGRLVLTIDGTEHDLGGVADLPLTLGGHARHNLANLAAAALAAVGLGIPPATIAASLARFGSDPGDNRGRLEHYLLGGIEVLLDYAHNPEGLHGLLGVAAARRGRGRLGLLLGQAGNREDDDIARLASVAAAASPDHVVLKDLDGFLRGRAPGEVPALLRDGLRAGGVPAEAMEQELQEASAARRLLRWSRAGDVLVMPLHAASARSEVLSLLERMRRTGWQAGQELP